MSGSKKSSRSYKKSGLLSRLQKRSKKLSKRNTRRSTIIAAVIIFAGIASTLTYLTLAESEYPTGKDEIVLEYRRETPVSISRDGDQTVTGQQQGAFARVLGDGTIECGAENSAEVLTGKLPAGQLKQLFKDGNTSGIKELPDEQFSGDDTSNFVGNLESVVVNSTDEPKAVILYDSVPRPEVFDRVTKMINQQCTHATKKQNRTELREVKRDLVSEKRDSKIARLLGSQKVSAATSGLEQSSENDQLFRINAHRSSHLGRNSLAASSCVTNIARIHVKRMADAGYIYHNPNLAAEISYACGGDAQGLWTKLGENVGVGYDSPGLFDAYVASTKHHLNIDDPDWNFMGVGAYRSSDGRLWTVQLYARCIGCGTSWTTPPSYVGDPAPVVNTTPKYFKWDSSPKRIPASADYNGDGKLDPGMWSRDTGNWYIPSLNIAMGYGRAGDVPIPADYDGDGKADLAVWRQSDHTFYRRNIGNVSFGLTTDVPVPADYNGDGKTDIAIFRASEGKWYIRGFGAGGAHAIYRFGTLQDDIPLPADYNGDGKADLALFRTSNHTWYAKNLSGTYIINGVSYGRSTDIPVPADYNGDRKTDIAVRRPSTKVWYIKGIGNSSSGFGLLSSDIPAPGDYDNDGKANIGILRITENKLYYRLSLSDNTTNMSILLAN